MFKKIVILFIYILILFALLELLCSLLPLNMDKTSIRYGMDTGWGKGPYAKPDFLLGYRLIPNKSIAEYNFNSIGYRGKEFSREKPNNIFRIICLGDGTTTGSNTGPDYLTFPAILEEIFKDTLGLKDRRIEVINAGVFGYSSWHYLLQIESELSHYGPDLYLIMGGLKDLNYSDAMSIKDILRFSKQNETIYEYLVRFKTVDKYLSKMNSYKLFKKYVLNSVSDNYRFSLNKVSLYRKIKAYGYENNMNRIIKHCKRNNISVAVINYPWIVRGRLSLEQEKLRLPFQIDDKELSVYTYGRKLVPFLNRRITNRNNIPYINPQNIFDENTLCEEGIYRIYSDNMHFTRYGNYLIACEVYKKIMELKRLKEFIGEKDASEQEEIDRLFYDIVSWRPPSGSGWPDDINSSPKVEIVRMEGLVSEKSEYSGWDFYKVSEDSVERIGRIRLLIDRDSLNDRSIIFYPRLIYPANGIYIDLIKKDGVRDRIFSVSPYANNEWTPVSGRYEVIFPMLQDKDIEIEITLDGENAQLWHCEEKMLFYN